MKCECTVYSFIQWKNRVWCLGSDSAQFFMGFGSGSCTFFTLEFRFGFGSWLNLGSGLVASCWVRVLSHLYRQRSSSARIINITVRVDKKHQQRTLTKVAELQHIIVSDQQVLRLNVCHTDTSVELLRSTISFVLHSRCINPKPVNCETDYLPILEKSIESGKLKELDWKDARERHGGIVLRMTWKV